MQLPPRYTGRLSGAPLWPFGFGLSYTTFTFAWTDGGTEDDAYLHQTTDESAVYSVNVTNTGPRAGAVSVLAFVEGGDGIARPLSTLFGFDKLWLVPGQSAAVLITTRPSACFSQVDAGGRRWLKAGSYRIAIGDVEQPARRKVRVEGDDLLVADYSAVFA